MSEYDVVIVGGGPAGVCTALFLAHAAPERTPRILVLEKECYPREKFCAGALGARGDRLLGSIGVTVTTPSVPVAKIAFRAQGRTIEVGGAAAIGRVVRRVEFDHALVRQARARGIRVLESQRVRRLERGSSGCVVHTDGAAFATKVVVGADGVASTVRRLLGVESARYHAQAVEVDTEIVASDLGRDTLLFDVSERGLPGYYWDFPTIVDGRALVCRGVYLLKTGHDEHAPEIQSVLAGELAARGLDLSRYKKKRYAERGFDASGVLSCPRVLLVGEAAGIDPVTGEGIAQAIQYGQAAGAYLSRKLCERDFQFDDWGRAVRGHGIGRDLLTRSAGAPLFYGPTRPAIERYLLETPDFIRVGMQHFAGEPWSKRALANAAWRALLHSTRWAISERSRTG